MSTTSNASELEGYLGLHAAKRVLRGIFARKDSVHAVMFYGEEGSGKSGLSNLLARFWLCLEPGPEGPCGACKACAAQERGSNPDLLRIRPVGSSAWIRLHKIHPVNPMPEDEEPTVPIQEFLRTMPLRSKHKVVVMEQAHRMTADASHALLKSLEEPETYAKFVLTTDQISQVRPTIRSRCLLVPCELPDEREWLERNALAEDWELRLAARSPGRLQMIRENPEPFAEIYRIASELPSLPPGAALAVSDRFKRAVEQVQKHDESSVRSAGTLALRILGTALRSIGYSPAATQAVSAAHTRIQGNAQGGYAYDALFVRLLADNRGRAG
jgi:DNA polymerase-3 subunit delta'